MRSDHMTPGFLAAAFTVCHGNQEEEWQRITQHTVQAFRNWLSLDFRKKKKSRFDYTEYFRKYILSVLSHCRRTLDSPVRLGSHTLVSFLVLILFLLPFAKQNYLREIHAAFRIIKSPKHNQLSSEHMWTQSQPTHLRMGVNPATANCTSEHREPSHSQPTSEWVWTQPQPNLPQCEFKPSHSQPFLRASVNLAIANSTSERVWIWPTRPPSCWV